MDERICINFCVKNEIKCNKVCEILTKAYGESAMSKTRVYEWYKRFQDAVKTLKMTNAPDAPAHQQLMKTWIKREKWLWTIAESQSEKSLMMLTYRLAHAMKFFRMFWVWNAWQQNLFRNCWILNKNSGEWKLLRSHWMKSTTMQNYWNVL